MFRLRDQLKLLDNALIKCETLSGILMESYPIGILADLKSYSIEIWNSRTRLQGLRRHTYCLVTFSVFTIESNVIHRHVKKAGAVSSKTHAISTVIAPVSSPVNFWAAVGCGGSLGTFVGTKITVRL